MAIIISSLGLLGISLFDIRQRYREIAIRKVNGASAKDLYRLLFRKYITVLITFISYNLKNAGVANEYSETPFLLYCSDSLYQR